MAAGILAVVPLAPAAAVQTISWATSPPANAVVGQQVSFSASATANTFLGARITGCYVNFPDGNNYTNSYGGNFTTGTCSYTNRTLSTVGNYQVVVGFTLSTGSTMSIQWNIAVSAPTPTLVGVPSRLDLTATGVGGATMPALDVHGTDSYYGTSSATCTPAAGTTIPVGTRTGSCTTTNAGAKSAAQNFSIVVAKGTPTLSWSPSVTVPYGTTYGDLEAPTVNPSGIDGTLAYTDGTGTPVDEASVIPVGSDQVLETKFVPSGSSADAFNESAVASQSVTVTRAAQTVAFDAGTPTSTSYGDAPFPVTATGTSVGDQVSISVQDGSSCTVDSPSGTTSVTATVTLTGAGSCVLLADQAANVHYSAAPTAQASVTVAKRTSAITWAPASSLTYGDTLEGVLTATADLPGTIAYTVDGDPVTAATVLDAGADQSVVATFTPTDLDNHTDAVDTRTVTVEQATQGLEVAPIADTTYDVDPFDLDVTDSGPGSVTTSALGACAVDGLEVTVVSVGDCTVTVTKAGDDNHLPATVDRTFHVGRAVTTLTWTPPSTLTYGDTLAGVLTATADLPGIIDYTVDGDRVTGATVLDAGVDQSVVATFTPTDPDSHTDAVANRTITVQRASQTLQVAPIADTTYGADPFDLDVTDSGPGSVTTSALGACAVDDFEVTVVSVGDCTVTVTKAGDTNHLPASVDRTFRIARVASTLSWTPSSTLTYGDTLAGVLTATADLPGTIDYTVDGDPVTGSTVLAAGADQSVVATFTPTDADHHAGAVATRTITVQRAAQTLDVAPIADTTYGAGPFALDVTGSGPGSVTTSALGACTVTVLQVTIVSAGDCTLTVTKAGGGNHVTVVVNRTFHIARAVPTLSWTPPAAVVEGTALGDDQLSALANQPGSTTYTVDAGTAPARGQVLAAGAHVLHATFTPSDTRNFEIVTAQVPFTVNAVVVPPTPPRSPSVATSASRALTLDRQARSSASVACSSGTTRCTGTVTVVALRNQRVAGRMVRKGTVLAKGTFSIAAGATGKVVLRPTGPGRRALKAKALRQAQLRVGKQVRTVQLRR